MQKWIIILCFLVLGSCASKPEKPNPQDDIETAQVFLQAFNTGNDLLCKEFMIANDANEDLLKAQINILKQKTATQKKEIGECSIIIHNREVLTPKETIITYNTSVNKTIHKLKLIKKENKWKVDFGYTFNGNL